MLGQKMQDALNEQINAETYSAYLYLSMAAYFEEQGLPGMANWMTVQAQEEMVHAMKFYNFIIERNGRVILTALEGPGTEWDSALAAFDAAYGHECKVTARINGLVDLAIAEKDHAANAFLQWFVTEQVEEEASTLDVAQRLKLAGSAPGALFMTDKELAARVFTPPPAAAAAG